MRLLFLIMAAYSGAVALIVGILFATLYNMELFHENGLELLGTGIVYYVVAGAIMLSARGSNAYSVWLKLGIGIGMSTAALVGLILEFHSLALAAKNTDERHFSGFILGFAIVSGVTLGSIISSLAFIGIRNSPRLFLNWKESEW